MSSAARCRSLVRVAAYGWRKADAEVVQQLLRLARVFAGNAINPLEHVERAQGDVAEVSNRRGDEIEAGG